MCKTESEIKRGSETYGYYHMFANGNDAKGFIICQEDYYAAFNRVGICAYNSKANVLSFSIEDTHPHILLYGTSKQCLEFKLLYERSTRHYIAATRGSIDGVVFDCSLKFINNEQYLIQVGVYTIYQCTKDGKASMPYYYLWGTGSMYFKGQASISLWRIQSENTLAPTTTISELTYRERRKLLRSHMTVPGNWIVSNGFLLPENYIAVELFEQIYRTPNRFRVFLASNSKKDDAMMLRIASGKGVQLEDFEARRLCKEICKQFYNKETTRWLSTEQRLMVAKTLKRKYQLSLRQLSMLTRIPEKELAGLLKAS